MVELNISFVVEDDINLILIEEATVSRSFVSWLLESIGLPDGELVKATRKRHTDTGESDIELSVRCDVQLTIVLIENKIDARFSERQPERYTERAESYVKHDQEPCDSAITVLVAPSSYIANAEDHLGFDSSITYESILAWFEAAAHLGKRREFKEAVIRAAIDRCNSGWKKIEDATITEFHRSYWEIASREFPKLRLKEPPTKPARSWYAIFRPSEIPQKDQLNHHVTKGRISLQFAGWGGRIAEFQERYGNRFREDMWLDKAVKSAAVRIAVEPIDMRTNFDVSEQNVRAALKAAEDFVRWYVEVFGRLAPK